MSVEQELSSLVFEVNPDRVTETKLPPGVVGVLTREVGTFKDFTQCYRRLRLPARSGETFQSGGEKVAARNACVDVLLANKHCEWLWQMDDDHKFSPTVLLEQLDVFESGKWDVLGMLYLTRMAPFDPVGGAFKRDIEGRIRMRRLTWADLPKFTPVLERPDLALGTAGLLIRRSVFDRLEPPYFRVGQLTPEKEHEDLEFSVRCQAARLKMGLWCGEWNRLRPTFVGIGHTMRVTVWPRRDPDGGWGYALDMDERFTGSQPLNGNGG